MLFLKLWYILQGMQVRDFQQELKRTLKGTLLICSLNVSIAEN